MNKKTRANLKHIAIFVALAGGTVMTASKALKLIDTYYVMKIELTATYMLVDIINESHPEAVVEATEKLSEMLGTIASNL